MRKVEWTDFRGRKFLSVLEDHEPDESAPYGILLGPPPDVADDLGLPEDTATQLHNQLFHRGLLAKADVTRRPQELHAALMAAMKMNVQKIMAKYDVTTIPDDSGG